MHIYGKGQDLPTATVDFGLEANARRVRLHTLTEIVSLLERLEDRMRVLGYSRKDLFSLRLAVQEAVTNAVRHGNRNDPGKHVQITYLATPAEVVVEIQDEGRGFNPAELPDPLSEENLDRPSGRGVFLMRAYTSWMSFNRQGNCVTLCRRRSGP
jgi:serine/threonine-protein kinase RsbW